VSEGLQYPEYCLVAVYRKLVVGVAVLVPNASATESYLSYIGVHPEWQRLGIASFFLLFLIEVWT
jgi:cysteine-rich protein 2-binding protein